MRHNWTVEEIFEIHSLPLLELIGQAHIVHREHHDPSEVQVCSLISIKTGGCSEDCKYCPQSARYQTSIQAHALMSVDEVLSMAKNAIQNGASRICMGAAWRSVKDSPQFDRILEMVKGITAMGAEVCVTLGMLTEEQAQRLADAGLYAYNHNLDSSREFYETIITTRTYDERLETLSIVEKTNLSVCCGGIIGMGETIEDRIKLLHTLSIRTPHPESVPINRLLPIPGTPLADQPTLPIWDFIRMVATTRIVMPKAMVRLSAGRVEMTYEQQALCFLAGANSIFSGDKLLTTPNPPHDKDAEMFSLFQLTRRPAFKAEEEEEIVFAPSSCCGGGCK